MRKELSVVCLAAVAACSPPDDAAYSVDESAAPVQEQSVHEGYSDAAPEYVVDGNVVSNVDVRARLWNPRGKTPEEIQERADYLLEAYDLKRTPEQQARALEARQKYAEAIAVNSIMIGAAGVAGHEAEHFAKGLVRNREAGLRANSRND